MDEQHFLMLVIMVVLRWFLCYLNLVLKLILEIRFGQQPRCCPILRTIRTDEHLFTLLVLEVILNLSLYY
jgi:hypothetical protein